MTDVADAGASGVSSLLLATGAVAAGQGAHAVAQDGAAEIHDGEEHMEDRAPR